MNLYLNIILIATSIYYDKIEASCPYPFENGYIKTVFNDNCGLVTEGNILNGQEVDPGKYPWMAALLRPYENPVKLFCGGSLITDQHILTAAHCVNDKGPSDIIVRLGAYDFTLEPKDSGSVDYDVKFISIYANYDHRSLRDDIAILTLASRADFTKIITPICLPNMNRSYKKPPPYVIGWGKNHSGGELSDKLREVQVDIIDRETCIKSYNKHRITDKIICAGGHDRDACKGDSGGPLMLKGRQGKWMAIGIVSGGIECGETNHPGLYTKVNEYLCWINGIIRKGGILGRTYDISINGPGIRYGRVRKFNKITITAEKKVPDSLDLKFRGPGPVDISGSKILNKGSNSFHYRMKKSGNYYLSVMSEGKEISGSPFHISVF